MKTTTTNKTTNADLIRKLESVLNSADLLQWAARKDETPDDWTTTGGRVGHLARNMRETLIGILIELNPAFVPPPAGMVVR